MNLMISGQIREPSPHGNLPAMSPGYHFMPYLALLPALWMSAKGQLLAWRAIANNANLAASSLNWLFVALLVALLGLVSSARIHAKDPRTGILLLTIFHGSLCVITSMTILAILNDRFQ